MADDNNSRSVSHCPKAAAVGSSLHSTGNIPASNKEDTNPCVSTWSISGGETRLPSAELPLCGLFRSFARAQRHCNKSSGEKSQCGFVIYQNPHFFCISPASQETGWKETKLNIILSFSLVILSPNGFLDPFQLKTPLGIVAAHWAAGVGAGDQCFSG